MSQSGGYRIRALQPAQTTPHLGHAMIWTRQKSPSLRCGNPGSEWKSPWNDWGGCRRPQETGWTTAKTGIVGKGLCVQGPDVSIPRRPNRSRRKRQLRLFGYGTSGQARVRSQSPPRSTRQSPNRPVSICFSIPRVVESSAVDSATRCPASPRGNGGRCGTLWMGPIIE